MRFAKIFVAAFVLLLSFEIAGAQIVSGDAPVELMKYTQPAPKKGAKFYKVLDKILPSRGLKKENICNQADAVQMRLLNEYGAMFVAGEGVVPPPGCIFTDKEAVEKFQQGIFKASATVGETYFELQTVALEKYTEARAEALKKNLDITPRGGTEAARRSFDDTVRLWKSRFEPACEHWLKEGRLTAAQVAALRKLPLKEQVGAVLELEKQGIFFNTFFNYSILQSVAAPGASQHLSMLALDVTQFEDETVRKILAKHGWFRTVQNDAPHFTFLNRKEDELKKYGLRRIETKDGEFWIPDIE